LTRAPARLTGGSTTSPCLPAPWLTIMSLVGMWHAPCFRRLLEDTKNKFVCSPLQQDGPQIVPRTSDRTATSSSALTRSLMQVLMSPSVVALHLIIHAYLYFVKAINHNSNRRMKGLHRMKPHSEPPSSMFQIGPTLGQRRRLSWRYRITSGAHLSRMLPQPEIAPVSPSRVVAGRG
jgi:hypothetical protein